MECIHHWKLSNPYRDNGHRITHHRCLRCGGEKDLVEKLVDLKKYVSIIEDKRLHEVLSAEYTDIIYPEKEETMGAMTKDNWKERNAKSKEYQQRKQEIIDAFQRIQAINETARYLEMSPSTLRGLLIRWDIYKPGPTIKETRPIQYDTQYDNKCKCVNGDIPLKVVEHLITLDKEIAIAYWDGYKAGRGL